MRQNMILLIAFISIAIGLFGISESYFNPKETETEAKIEVQEESKITVWLMKEPLKEGEQITLANVYKKQIVESKANEVGIYQDVEIEIKPGDVVRQDFARDDYFTQQSIVNKKSPEYIDLILKQGMVPYPFATNISTVYGGVIDVGDYIDVISLTSLEQNFADNERVDSYRSVSVSPLLTAVRILAVEDVGKSIDKNNVTLVLELSRSDIAKMVIAKRVSQLEVHKSSIESFGGHNLSVHKADTGDVLPDYFSVTELRGKERIVN